MKPYSLTSTRNSSRIARSIASCVHGAMVLCIIATFPSSAVAGDDEASEGKGDVSPGSGSLFNAELAERMRIAHEDGDHRQRYRDLHLPILEEARENPEALWKFLTDPATPYLERQAAAHRCTDVFPPEFVPRLVDAIEALKPHSWGVRRYPINAAFAPGGGPEPMLPDEPINVLGHEWEPVAAPIDHPLTWDEHVAAPWPWQVERALNATWSSLSHRMPRHHRMKVTEMALQLPRATDDEARHFLKLSDLGFRTIEVLAAYYEIALDPVMETAAWEIMHFRMGFVRNPRTPHAPQLGAVLVEDVLRHSPHARAREAAAYRLKSFPVKHRRTHQTTRPIVPYAAIIAASERAIDEETGRERYLSHIERGRDMTQSIQWHRLSVYAFSVCETVPDPPIVVDRRMGHRSPEVAVKLDRFAEWFHENREMLEARAARQQSRIDAARAALRGEQPVNQ